LISDLFAVGEIFVMISDSDIVLEFLVPGKPLPGMPGSNAGPVPIIHMYGITMEGNSVLCHIHGFVPYFYVPAPSGFEQSHCSVFREGLDKAVLNDMRSNKDGVMQVRNEKEVSKLHPVTSFTPFPRHSWHYYLSLLCLLQNIM